MSSNSPIPAAAPLRPQVIVRDGAASAVAPSIPSGGMLELTRAECLGLLASTSFGRIAVNGTWGPVIRPVNYVFDEPSQSVIFRTARGSKFHALLQSVKAAFEIDGIDPAGRTGWSVIMVGVSEEITGGGERRRLAALGVDTWAPGRRSHWVRVRANSVSGRRIVIAADSVAGDPGAASGA